MKIYGYRFVGVILLMFLIGCSTSQQLTYKLERKVPFQIIKAQYNNWIGGVEGVRGSNIELVIDNRNLKIDTLYFNNRRVVPQIKNINKSDLQIIGNIIKKSKPDLIIHKDPQKEFGNPAPVKTAFFPFDLLQNEMVLSYKYQGKTKYVKIELKKEDTFFYQ